MEGTKGTSGLRETYYSDTYKNLLYEKDHYKPKNIRDFQSTMDKDHLGYHDFGKKKDAGVVSRRAMDHRDPFDVSHRPGTITGNTKKINYQEDSFKTH